MICEVEEEDEITRPTKRPLFSQARKSFFTDKEFYPKLEIKTYSKVKHANSFLVSQRQRAHSPIKRKFSLKSPNKDEVILVYPKEPKYNCEQISLTSRDLDCLKPSRMLNDNIVSFGMIQAMEFVANLSGENSQLAKTNLSNMHIFNSFFYSKLLQIYNGKKSFDLIERWTKDVNLFDKRYLIIPVCQSYHWILIIVCNASLTPLSDDPIIVSNSGDIQPSSNKVHKWPAILICDSLRHFYMSKLTEPIRMFLIAQWKKERPNKLVPNFMDKRALPVVLAKVPKQKNTYDCGIYLLYTFYEFIKSPLNILSFAAKEEEMRFSCMSMKPEEYREKLLKDIEKERFKEKSKNLFTQSYTDLETNTESNSSENEIMCIKAYKIPKIVRDI